MSIASTPAYKLLPDLWSRDKIWEAILGQGAGLGILPKDTTFSEKKRYVPVGYGAPQGFGTTYGGAKFAKSPGQAVEWEITHKHFYGLFGTDGFLGRQSKYGQGKAVLVDPTVRDSKLLMNAGKRILSQGLYSNGGGALGVSSAIAGQRITFSSARAIRGLERNMLLTSSTTDGTSGAENAGYVTVAAVGNEDFPYVDVAEASVLAGIPGAIAGDYFFRRDTFGNMMSGFPAWLPAWTSGSLPGTFKGVPRNNFPERLAGTYLDCRTFSPRQALQQACIRSGGGEGEPTHYICSPNRWAALQTELLSANMMMMTKAPAAPVGKVNFGIEYDAMTYMGPRGKVMVLMDSECRDEDSWLIQADTWSLMSMSDLLHWEYENRQEDGADAKEAMLVGDYELCCSNPFPNVRLRHV